VSLSIRSRFGLECRPRSRRSYFIIVRAWFLCKCIVKVVSPEGFDIPIEYQTVQFSNDTGDDIVPRTIKLPDRCSLVKAS
jgi:hypothetical protein